MAADQNDLEQRLGDLAARLARIEDRLGLSVAPLPVPVTVQPSPVVDHVPPPLPIPVPVAPPVIPVGAAGTHTNDSAQRLEDIARKRAAAMAAARTDTQGVGQAVGRSAAAEPVRQFQAIPLPPSAHAPLPPQMPRPVPRSGTGPTVEQMFGRWVLAVAGSLFLVIGLVLGIKYGLDRGWFHFPPAYRCWAVAIIGLGLIGVGQRVRTLLGPAGGIAAAGLAGAGIAAIYGAAASAWGIFDLYGAPTAFTLLALISVGGIAIALWWNSLPVAVLALIGAYLNPIFMHNVHSDPRVLPVYLSALLVLGLTLAAWRPSPFRWLRMVSWWGTVVIGSFWQLGEADHSPFIALGFLAAVWVLIHSELLLGASRAPESTPIPGGTANLLSRLSRPMRSSFATTVWCVGAGILTVWSVDRAVHLEQWYVAAAGFVGTFVLALILAGNLRAFRDPPQTDRERLGVALWAQSGALLITTIALGVGEWTQAIAWLSMGVAAVAAGRWAKARSLDAYGVVVLCIAVGRLVTWDSWHLFGRPQEVLGLVVSSWSHLMMAGGAAWLVAAWLLNRPSLGANAPSHTRRVFVNVAIAVGVSLPFVGLGQDNSGIAMSVLAGTWALAMLVAAKLRDAIMLRIVGLSILGITSMVSLVVHFDSFGLNALQFETTRWHIAIGGMVLTKWSFALLWLAAIWIVGAWAARSRAAIGRLPFEAQAVSIGKWWGWGGSIVMITCAVTLTLLSLITPTTDLGSVCIAWTVSAIVLVALHTRRQTLALDVIGLGAFAATVLLWDFAYFVDHNWLAETRPPFSHPGLWTALAIVVAMFGACIWLWRGTPRRATWPVSVIISVAIAGVLLLGSTSLEISRSAGILLPDDHTAQAAALTLWWGLFAVAMLIAGFWMAIPVVRHLGLGLLGVAAVKAVFFDLAGVSQGWRVVSFLGLGILMMGVAIGYAKLAAYLDRQGRAQVAPGAANVPSTPGGMVGYDP